MSSLVRRCLIAMVALAASLTPFGSAMFVHAQSATQSCDVAIFDATPIPQQGSITDELLRIGGSYGQLSCKRICGASDSASQGCMAEQGNCAAGTRCCVAGVGIPASQQCQNTTGGSGSSASRGSSGFTLQLPACVSTGNCQLSDILQTGVNFANLLFGLAGALFLAIFVYAGFSYVFFAYDAKQVSSAKDMMKNAVIGLALMMVAGIFIRFVVSAVGGTGGVTEAQCSARHTGFSCVNIGASTSAARSQATARGCFAGECPGAASIMCCPPGAIDSTNANP